MSANFTPNQNEYKNLTPFKTWLMLQINTWGMTNFPFVESDFDELTNYGMMLKLMGAVNDVIANENEVEQDMTNLFNAFTELQSYVNDYFDNLDVQDEINAKLDAMAQDGSLTTLIQQYMNPYIDEQNGRITTIENEVQSLGSGSPAGVYDTLSNLETADPNHSKIYVVTATNKWYFYDTTNNEWTAGGDYLTSTIANNSINYNQLNAQLQETFNECYYNKQVQKATENGFFKYSTGQVVEHDDFHYYQINVQAGEKYYYSTQTRSDARAYVIVDSDDNVLDYHSGTASQTYKGFVTMPIGASKLYINNGTTGAVIYCVKCEKLELDPLHPLKNNYCLAYVNATNGHLQYQSNPLETKSITNIQPIYLKKGDVVCSEYPFTLARYNADGSFVSGSRTALTNYNETIATDGFYRISLFNYNDVAVANDYNTNSTITDDIANGLTFNKKYNKACYLHISFDDVYACLQDITTNANSYNSIFDNDFFADLKDLHDRFGCVFTLNCFNTRTTTTYDISNTTTKFRFEFNQNSDWLKFSFHAEDNTTYYNNDTSDILTSYNKFVTAVLNFATYNCIDNFIRLGFFTGSSNNIDYLLSDSCLYKIHGLLCADDTRNSYYLTSTQQSYVNNKLLAYDTAKDIYLIKSQRRLESDEDIALNSYNTKYICELFTHEQNWTSSVKTKLESLLRVAVQLNYNFVYFNEIFQLENHLPE